MVVICYASVFELVGCQDCVVTFIEQLRPMDGLVSSLVAVALFCQDGSWNTKPNSSINASPLETGFGFAVFGIGMERRHFVSEEARSTGSCMGDERFLLRKMELKFFPQERGDLPLNILRFRFWPGERERKVISVADIFEPSWYLGSIFE